MAMRAWVLRAEARINQLEAWRKNAQPQPQEQIAALLRRIDGMQNDIELLQCRLDDISEQPVKRGPGRPKKEIAE